MPIKRGCSLLFRLFLYIPIVWIIGICFVFGYFGLQGPRGNRDFSVESFKKNLAKKAIEILDDDDLSPGNRKRKQMNPVEAPHDIDDDFQFDDPGNDVDPKLIDDDADLYNDGENDDDDDSVLAKFNKRKKPIMLPEDNDADIEDVRYKQRHKVRDENRNLANLYKDAEDVIERPEVDQNDKYYRQKQNNLFGKHLPKDSIDNYEQKEKDAKFDVFGKSKKSIKDESDKSLQKIGVGKDGMKAFDVMKDKLDDREMYFREHGLNAHVQDKRPFEKLPAGSRVANKEKEMRMAQRNPPAEQGGDILEHDPHGPGEHGQGFVVDEKQLSPDDKKKFDDGWKKYQFNEFASNKISVFRTLPDYRSEECKNVVYDLTTLPDTSIIVVFRNEAWSTLLRTMHSCINRSPDELLNEFIIVDDFSELDKFVHLGKQLEDYIATMPKVKLIRAKKREGLIRARLLGSAVAKGTVLTFLDSHVECTDGWLTPMMARVYENFTTVPTPVIATVDQKTLRASHSGNKPSQLFMGAFLWDMYFMWFGQPSGIHHNRGGPPVRSKIFNKDGSRPISSPTMAGGLFSIHRDWFEQLGTYDSGMDFWGGENLELSFKVWLCGGSVEIHPCSHVGHIFRTNSPHSWPIKSGGMHPVRRNAIRLAETWLDEYRLFYYEKVNNKLGEYGDVSERKKIRDRLQCKNFQWYMENVWPTGMDPKKAIYRGEVRSVRNGLCIDGRDRIPSSSSKLELSRCHGQGGNQHWWMFRNGEIRREIGCWDYAPSTNKLTQFSCHGHQGNQQWEYTEDNQIKHIPSELCLEVGEEKKKDIILLRTCMDVPAQRFMWRLPPVHMPNPEGVAHLRRVVSTD